MTALIPAVPVADACTDVTVGIVVKPSQWYTASGVRCFRSQNIRENRVNDDGWVFITDEGHAQHRKSEVRAGDVLVVRTGAPGTACAVPDIYAGSNCIDLLIARPDPARLVPAYLALYLNSHLGKEEIRLRSGGLAQQHLNVSALERIALPLPSIQQQQTIVRAIAPWEDGLELLSARHAAARRHGAALLQALIGAHPRSASVRSHWADATFGEAFVEKQERNTASAVTLPITVGKYAIGRQSDKYTKSVTSSNVSGYWIIRPGDFVYDPMSAYYGAIGRYELPEPGIVSPAYRVQTLSANFDSDFMKFVLKSHHVRHQLEAFSSQNNKAGKRRLLQRDAFSEVCFPCPPVQEQKRIASVLLAADEEVALLDRQVAAYRTQRKWLLGRLLSGQVGGPVDSISP